VKQSFSWLFLECRQSEAAIGLVFVDLVVQT